MDRDEEKLAKTFTEQQLASMRVQNAEAPQPQL